MNTVDLFRSAIERQDLAAVGDLFTEDIRFYSPVKFTPFEGKPMVLGLFGVLLRTFEDFRYVGRFDGSAQTFTGDDDTPSAVLLFRTRVGDTQIHGIDLIHLDEESKINEFTVMLRPRSAAQAVSDAVVAGLVADGLIPTPTAP